MARELVLKKPPPDGTCKHLHVSDTVLPCFFEPIPQVQRIFEAMVSTLSVIDVLEMQLTLAIAVTLSAGPVLASLSWWRETQSFQTRVPATAADVNCSYKSANGLVSVFGCRRLLLKWCTRGEKKSSKPSPCRGKNSVTSDPSCIRQQELRGSDLSTLAPFGHRNKAFREELSSDPLQAQQTAASWYANNSRSSLQKRATLPSKIALPCAALTLVLRHCRMMCVSAVLLLSCFLLRASSPSPTWTGTW